MTEEKSWSPYLIISCYLCDPPHQITTVVASIGLPLFLINNVFCYQYFRNIDKCIICLFQDVALHFSVCKTSFNTYKYIIMYENSVMWSKIFFLTVKLFLIPWTYLNTFILGGEQCSTPQTASNT